MQKTLLSKGFSVFCFLSFHALANNGRNSPPNSMPILGDEVVAVVGEG
jgi:hypothetical protein